MVAEAQPFEAALGIEAPWFVRDVAFDAKARTSTIAVDFKPGTWMLRLSLSSAHRGCMSRERPG